MDKPFENGKFRIKANASFCIREGWLAKGLRHLRNGRTDVFIVDDATDILGVGSTMVKSMRFWMQASGLSVEPKSGKRFQTLTPIGEIISKYDPYFEDPFSMFVIHDQITRNREYASAWFAYSNYYTRRRFTKAQLLEDMKPLFEELGAKDFSEITLSDDCSYIIQTYSNDNGVDEQLKTPEDNNQCPLSDLGLLARNGDIYERTAPMKSKLDYMFVYYNIRLQCAMNSGVSIDDLLHGTNGVGKCLNLSSNRLNEYLDILQSAGCVTINRTAGLDMVYFKVQQEPITILEQYYKKRS